MADKTETAETVDVDAEKMTLSTKNIIGYAMGDLGGCMTFAILGSFLTSYYTDVAGISAGTVAAMYIVLKIWDAINDPLLGTIMDKLFATTKHPEKGKFRPWMWRSSILLFFTSIAMYTAPTFANGIAKVVVAFVTYLLYEASYTMFNVPYGSLLSAMAHNDIERSTCSSARGLGAAIGNIIPGVLFPIIIDYFEANEQLGYTLGLTVCAAIGLVCCLLSCWWTCERLDPGETEKTDEERKAEADQVKMSDIIVVFKKNRAFDALCIMGIFYCISQYTVSTLGVYLYRDVYGALTMYSVMSMVTMVVSFATMAVVPMVVKKLGLTNTVGICAVISAVLYALDFIFATNVYLYMIFTALAGAFSGVIVQQQWGMVGQAIDYNEYATGKRTEGSIYGVFNFMRRAGQAIGSSAAAAALVPIGYDAALEVQTAATATGIKALCTVIPAVCMLICFIAVKFVWNITPDVMAKVNEFQSKKTAIKE